MPPEDQYFRPRKWGQYQAVKRRGAEYVRNQTELLDSQKYRKLTLNQRAVLHGLWLLFGDTARPLPLDSGFIGARLGADCRATGVALKALLDCNYLEICSKTDSLDHDIPSKGEVKGKREIKKKETPNGVSKKKPPARRASVPDGFDEWWNEYPLKKGKQAAVKAYAKALQTTGQRELLEGLRAFNDAAPWGNDLRYCAHPTTWLNQGRWADEYAASGQAIDDAIMAAARAADAEEANGKLERNGPDLRLIKTTGQLRLADGKE